MSRLPFEVFLALRYLRPKRTFVSVITLISVLGVMLGVAVLLIVISVMSGFDRQLRDRILGFNAHLTVFEPGNTLTNYDQLAKAVATNAHVRGVMPYVRSQVLLKTQPSVGKPQIIAPLVRGSDPAAEGSVSVLPTNVRIGSFNLNGRSLLIGTELSRSLQISVGDHVAIYSANDIEKMEASRTNGVQQASLARDFTVTGVFDVGYYEFNAFTVETSLENAQELQGLLDADVVHALLVKLDDAYQAGAARAEILAALGNGYDATTWLEDNHEILDALIVEKNVMFYVLFFIMIVAAFGIMSSQITFVVQKTREIGMLKALGASNLQVMALFLVQSAFVGFVGVLAGYGLGMLAIAYRNEFLQFMRGATGFQLFPAEIYGFRELPALLIGQDIAVICVVSFVICVLAGMFPAWNASRLKPVEALRHE
jgi:lipoprotein-releasing system permease protein